MLGSQRLSGVVSDSKLAILLQIGRSPLHLAARNGHTEVVAGLLSARAAVDMTDDEGMTPLALAAAKGHTLAAGELIWGHADVNAVVQVLVFLVYNLHCVSFMPYAVCVCVCVDEVSTASLSWIRAL